MRVQALLADEADARRAAAVAEVRAAEAGDVPAHLLDALRPDEEDADVAHDGEATAALAERARTGSRPEVVTWMRRPRPGEKISPELRDLRARIDAGELDLPYRTYDDLRVVELDLLARLRPYGADLEPRRVGDFVYLGDEPVIDLG